MIGSAVVKTAELINTPGRPKAGVRDAKMSILTATVSAVETSRKKGGHQEITTHWPGLLGTSREEGEVLTENPDKALERLTRSRTLLKTGRGK